MSFPLNSLDMSIFLAVITTILLATSELLWAYHGKMKVLLRKRRLRNTAITVSIFLLVAVAFRIVGIVLNV